MARFSKQEQEEAIKELRERIKPGDTLYTVLRNVSSSGMSRRIDVYLIRNNEPQWLSRAVANATEIRFSDKHECLVVGGCGMDMGLAVVYDLSSTLYGDGYAIKQKWL